MNGIGPLAFAPLASISRIRGYLRLARIGSSVNRVIVFIRGGRAT